MTTAARPVSSESCHWYDPKTGTACHTVIAKGTGLPRPTTLADAKKMGLLPSVSGILRVLDKPALNNWKTEQAVLAACTTPRLKDEPLDVFIKRVLSEDAEAEGQKARDFGTRIHAQLEHGLRGGLLEYGMEEWCRPVIDLVAKLGKPIATEKIVVGMGYAGTLDALIYAGDSIRVLDFKTTKSAKLPTKSYIEHRLGLSAYAAAIVRSCFYPGTPLTTANIYISSVTPGMITVCENDDWQETFENGFQPILQYWQWANNYSGTIL